jgi:putative tryptophan/tyrosine transport system substrate-binding protein
LVARACRRGDRMRRREFIALIGSTAASWPLAARAQQLDRIRRVGVLFSTSDDLEVRSHLAAFRQKLGELGWLEGRNLRLDVCWSEVSADRAAACASKLADFTSDAILSSGPEALLALRQATGTIPIVFVMVGEPVESGVVSSLARPDSNVTGLAAFEYSIGGKWVELLKQVAPDVVRVGVLRNAAVFTHPGYLRAIESAAPTFGVSVIVMDASNADELDSLMNAIARESDGLIVVLIIMS